MRRGRGRLWVLTTVAIAAAVVLAACDSGQSEAPDLAIALYQGGDVLGEGDATLSEIIELGKPVVVNFWAALCGPCRLEMPEFQRIHERRGGEVTIVGVDIGPQWQLGTSEQGQAFLVEVGVKYPAGTSADPEVNTKFSILGMPTTAFIDSDGRLRRTWTGALTEAKIDGFIDELLEG